MPAVFAVKLKLAPAASVPLSKLVPSLEVAVWAISSLFFQVTVVPVFIVSVAGPNAILTIDIELPEGGFEPPADVFFDLLQTQFIKNYENSGCNKYCNSFLFHERCFKV